MYVPSKSIIHNSTAMFALKPSTLAGFNPGPSVSEADTMSTAPRRQRPILYFKKLSHRDEFVP
jgi:hypothetical protein